MCLLKQSGYQKEWEIPFHAEQTQNNTDYHSIENGILRKTRGTILCSS
jgi:hypothetical protein